MATISELEKSVQAILFAAGDPYEKDRHGKKKRRQISRQGRIFPEMVVRARRQVHPQDPQQRGKHLLLQVVKGVVELHFPIVGAGTVEDDKSKDQKRQKRGEKSQIILPLSWLCQSYLHSL